MFARRCQSPQRKGQVRSLLWRCQRSGPALNLHTRQGWAAVQTSRVLRCPGPGPTCSPLLQEQCPTLCSPPHTLCLSGTYSVIGDLLPGHCHLPYLDEEPQEPGRACCPLPAAPGEWTGQCPEEGVDPQPSCSAVLQDRGAEHPPGVTVVLGKWPQPSGPHRSGATPRPSHRSWARCPQPFVRGTAETYTCSSSPALQPR